MTDDKPHAVASNALLEPLGFVLGRGFSGEVWTNTNSTWMTQVWVCVSGGFDGGDRWFDARNGLDMREFFSWWEYVSRLQHDEDELEIARLSDE